MTDDKRCPLCGKIINADIPFCEDCQHHMDKQYDTEFLSQENLSETDKSTQEEEKETTVVQSENDENNTNSETTEKTVEKKKSRKGIIFILLGCILIVLVGVISSLKVIENRKSIENEDYFWITCVEENTPLSYAKYLISFPEGRYTEEANIRIREFREEEIKAWERLRKSSDINDFYAYLGENPNTPYINQIKFLTDSLSWLATIKDNTADSYKAYIENTKLENILGNHLRTAEERYDYLSRIKHLEGAALDSTKAELLQMFHILSENKPNELLRLFAPQVVYFNTDTTSTETVAAIEKYYQNEKIKKIDYTPDKESVIVQKDNVGVLFVDVVINKEITYNTKIKVGKKTQDKKEQQTDTLKIKVNKEKQIESITVKEKS